MSNNNERWNDIFDTTVGGSKEALIEKRLAASDGTQPQEEETPLQDFFKNLGNQWKVYDLAFVVGNPIKPNQDPDVCRAQVNENLQDIIGIVADCTSRKYSGLETHVMPRRIGIGLYTFSHVFRMEDPAQLEEAVDSATNELPTLFPGLVVRPGERVLALLGSGSRTLLEPLAERIKDGLQPVKWGACLGGDFRSSSAAAFLVVNLKGNEIKKLMGTEHPTLSVMRWRKRAEELWERAVQAG